MRIGFIAELAEADFRFAADNGIPCVEYNFGSGPMDAGLAQRDFAAHWIKEYHVSLNSVGLFGRDFIADDESEAQRQIEAAQRVVEFCAFLNVPVFVTGAGQGTGHNLEENAQKAVDYLGFITDYAQQRGVKTALYNCHWSNFAYHPETWKILLNAVPDLGLKYDPSHAFYDDRDYIQEMFDWGDRILHVHAKGCIKNAAGRPLLDPPPGLDQIAWGAYFAALYHHEYRGDINIEPHAFPWNAEKRYAGILFAKRYLERFLI